MKQYSKLKEVLINAVSRLVDTELTGYIVYSGEEYKLVNPDYSAEKEVLIKMIDECNEKMGFDAGEE